MMPLGSLLLVFLSALPQDASATGHKTKSPHDTTGSDTTGSDTTGNSAQAGGQQNPHANPHGPGGSQSIKSDVSTPASEVASKPRNTEFSFSPAQPAVQPKKPIWGDDWYAMDDPKAAGVHAALGKLENTRRRIYRSRRSGDLLLVRDIKGFESPFEAFAADEEQMNRGSEFITENDGTLDFEKRELVYLECEWSLAPARRVVAFYTEPKAGSVRSVWIIGSAKSKYRKLLKEAESQFPHTLATLEPLGEESYYSVLGGHLLGFELSINPSKKKKDRIELKPVDQPRAGERAYIDSVFKANPQFNVSVVQNWMDETNDVALSYQIIEHDNGLGVPKPFSQWLAGQFQSYYRDNKDLGDFPVEMIHDPNTLTQVISPEDLASHYARNKRAPDSGVILGVYIPRSPYARNFQLHWMNTEGERPMYGYARLIGLRRYVRSRSETIVRNSVAILMLSGSDRTKVEQAAAGLKPRSMPLADDDQLLQ